MNSLYPTRFGFSDNYSNVMVCFSEVMKLDMCLNKRLICRHQNRAHLEHHEAPFLWLLLSSPYINDLPSVCHNAEIQMYGDDTVVRTRRRDDEQVAAKLLLAFVKVAKWLKGFMLYFEQREGQILGYGFGLLFSIFRGEKHIKNIEI